MHKGKCENMGKRTSYEERHRESQVIETQTLVMHVQDKEHPGLPATIRSYKEAKKNPLLEPSERA